MSKNNGSAPLFADESADVRPSLGAAPMTDAERDEVARLGNNLARKKGGIWLLISGGFTSDAGDDSTENLVKEQLRGAFGYPAPDESELVLNVVLHSSGGSLDSAYTTALYLSAYAKKLNVYVPSRAKSASTLLAIAADQLYLSAFGELGPLDTQIPDPRNPANKVSALDCYQSVDYVRDFGFETITVALPELIKSTERRIPVTDLLKMASKFAIGAIKPVLSTITALDLGAWGRSLRIGEQYARMLLQAKAPDGDEARAKDIAEQLVYGYTHHPFPIDYYEAKRIGLQVEHMDGKTYRQAAQVLKVCNDKNFVGFLSKPEAKRVKAGKVGDRVALSIPARVGEDRAHAEIARVDDYRPPKSRSRR